MEDSSDPLKLLVIGFPGVGKTCLLNRIYGDDFAETNEDWDLKRTTLTSGNITRSVILTDTSGEERFRELTSASYKNADIVFIVYAIDDQASFDQVEKWIGEVNRYVTNKSIPRVLVGNKIDLENRVISTEKGQTYATEHGMQFLETSAKTNHNVDAMIKIALTPPGSGKSGGGCCLVQ